MIGQISGGQNAGPPHDGAVKTLLTRVLGLLFWKLQSQGVLARTDRMLLHRKAGESGPSPTWTRLVLDQLILRSILLASESNRLRIPRVGWVFHQIMWCLQHVGDINVKALDVIMQRSSEC